MKRLIPVVLICTIFTSIILYLIFNRNETQIDDGRIDVVVSFYPLFEFTKNIGGNLINVHSITPPGVEPHDFEPTVGDVLKLNRADLVIFNGAGFESWAKRVASDLENKDNLILDISNTISDLIYDQDKVANPHFWVDPILAKEQVTAIGNSLIEIDPKNMAIYDQNKKEYVRKLDLLDSEIREGLSRCTNKTVIVSHDAFGYYAKRYNLEMIGVSGLSPLEEPSAAKIADIVELAKSKNIKYIFFDSLVSPKLAETLANEIGGGTLELDSIEGISEADKLNGLDYFSIQRQNLKNLKIALQCD
ncbi:MAG: zinc ABC transporter substrate-binding protein [bacterium]|nr:zinc ABC transporter substrate-binding protein [bacterium]